MTRSCMTRPATYRTAALTNKEPAYGRTRVVRLAADEEVSDLLGAVERMTSMFRVRPPAPGNA